MIDCPKGTERDLASRYLAGKLGEEEAVAFEEHFFACASCREDVERGSELRVVLGKEPIVAAIRPARARLTWLPLAAAAAIAFVGLGVWQMTRRSAGEPGRSVMRSTLPEVLELKASAGPAGSIELTWSPHPDAASYSVHVLAADDSSVWKAKTTEPRLTIASGVLPAPDGVTPLSVEVEAFDSMGQAVAKSELTPLPKR